MIKVGITGNYFSGYDDVSKLFENQVGVPVFDADVILKFIINYKQDIIDKIKIKFGSGVYKNGIIIPSIFNTTEKFDCLLDLADMELLRSYEKWRLSNKNFFYTIFKSSILYERDYSSSMDYNITVFKPKIDRVYDLSSKTKMLVSSAYDVINKEMDELVKNNHATHIIHNYDDAAPISKQVHSVHDSINKKNMLNTTSQKW
jgi:dephospho-CoA kinase